MSNLLKKLLMVALAIPTLAMAQVSLDKVVATVAGEPITAQEVQEKINTNVSIAAQTAAQAKKAFKLTKAQQEEIQQASFGEVIQNHILLNKAKNLGVGVSDSDINQALTNIAQSQGTTLDGFKQAVVKQGGEKGWSTLNNDLRTDMIKSALIKREVEDKISIAPEEINAFLDAKKLGSNNPIPITKGAEASHIFVAGTKATSKKKIDDAKARLDKGEAFEAVARSMSENPQTAANGGKIPFIAYDESADPAIVKVVEGTADGSTSGVVQTKNGFHIFKVVKQTAIEFSLKEQENIAKNVLLQQKMPAAFEAWMKDLMESSKSLVEIKN